MLVASVMVEHLSDPPLWSGSAEAQPDQSDSGADHELARAIFI
jgi:hypothetical protein